MTDALKKLYKRMDGYKGEIIDLQGKLTAIKAISPDSEGHGEWEKAKFLKIYMDKLGFDSFEEYNCPDERTPEGTRPNLIAKIKGKKSDKTIWVMGHMDVVPEGDVSQWNSDPFKIKVEGDKIFGRGTEDNQQAIVSSLIAIKALKEEKIKPEYDIGLIFVADEENGSKYGIDYVLKKSKSFKKEDYFYVPDAGDPEGVMIEVAEKSIVWIKFAVKGKQTHASTPERGINAHKASAALVIKLENLYKKFADKDDVFDPPISTFEPTKKEANVPNVNTIPGEDVFYFDCRILPKHSLENVLETVKSCCSEIEKEYGVKIENETVQRADAAPPTPVDAPAVFALKSAVKDVYNVEAKPMGIGGGTVAAFFRRAGYYAVCWTKLDESLHGPNEYCKISNVIGDAKVFTNIFLQK